VRNKQHRRRGEGEEFGTHDGSRLVSTCCFNVFQRANARRTCALRRARTDARVRRSTGEKSARISGRAQRVRARPRAAAPGTLGSTWCHAERIEPQTGNRGSKRNVVMRHIGYWPNVLTVSTVGLPSGRQRWQQRWKECPGEFRGVSVHLAVLTAVKQLACSSCHSQRRRATQRRRRYIEISKARTKKTPPRSPFLFSLSRIFPPCGTCDASLLSSPRDDTHAWKHTVAKLRRRRLRIAFVRYESKATSRERRGTLMHMHVYIHTRARVEVDGVVRFVRHVRYGVYASAIGEARREARFGG